MKIAIMSAGGLGSNYGARLAKDGHDVTFIARGAHLRAMRENGLTVKVPDGTLTINPVPATDNPADIGVVDWVLFAVKTYDTDSAARAIKPIVGANTNVITFQNGVEAPEQIGAIVGRERVIVGPTQIFSNIIAPGVIEQKSPFANTVIGEVGGQGLTPRVQAITAALKRAGVNASAVADGRTPLWEKFALIASNSGLTTLANSDAYDLFQLPEARATLRAALEEVYRVAEAYGVPLDADLLERHYNFVLTFKPGMKSSMHLDRIQGKRLEVDAINGAVVRLGAAKNIATPVHQTIYIALKMEDDRVRRGMA